jgi:predicted RNA-binding protein with RPS1 domain
MIKTGDIVEAEIFKITSFGAFAKLENGQKALIHISQIRNGFVENISDYLKLGDRVTARVLKIEAGRIDLTLKTSKQQQQACSYPDNKEFKINSFADKLQDFALKSD